MGIVAHTGRYLRSVAHLKPGQPAWRLYYRLRKGLGLVPRPRWPEDPPAFDTAALDRLEALARLWAAVAPVQAATLEPLRRGCFSFLRTPAEHEGKPPWQDTRLPRLWRYHLHYFDYARAWALGALNDPEQGEETPRRWIAGWMAENPPGTDVAWDAFPMAARLMNWAVVEAVFRWEDPAMRCSYAQQARALLRSLEYDVRANHLLQNAAGLAVAGVLLNAPFLQRALDLLQRETGEQVLEDGGHYERSAMYHCHVLEWLIVVHAVLAEPPEWLTSAIGRMDRFLRGVCHPDGGIPLFGDATLDGAAPPATLHKLTAGAAEHLREGNTAAHAFPESGFYLLGTRGGDTRLIAKAGAPGPAYQLGHAHADALSYECAVQGRRVLVDSGVHGYAESRFRGYCRSTRAHNTVSVNGREQLEAWGVFRVGHRYTAEVHAWGRHARGMVLRASHDGFKPYTHHRTIHFLEEGFWLVVDDIGGPGRINAESFVHVHPDFTLAEEPGVWRAGPVALLPFGLDSAVSVRGGETPAQGWYCPEFGRALPADTLILRAADSSQLRFGYAIVPNGAPAPAPAGLKALATELETLEITEPIDVEP